MITNKETTRNLQDVRVIFAVLWGAEIVSSLNGDTYRLSDPAVLKPTLANSGPMYAWKWTNNVE